MGKDRDNVQMCGCADGGFNQHLNMGWRAVGLFSAKIYLSIV